MLLRIKISSDSDALDLLHGEYNWIPSSKNVRRSGDIQAKQMLDMIPVQKYYQSFRDYILDTIFGAKIVMNSEGKLLAIGESNLEDKFKLVQNQFPYQVSKDTRHYIMWYKDDQPSDKKITIDINTELQDWEKYDQIQFVWYENPKIHREVYHVHVFIYQTLPILSDS